MRKASRNKTMLVLVGFLIFLFPSMPTAMAEEQAFFVDVTAVPFADFEPKSPSKRTFGKMRFLSGVYLASNKRSFGGFSAMKLLDGGKRVLAVSDSGYWLVADLKRDAKGAVLGFEKTRMARLYSGHGPSKNPQKYFSDAEALVVDGTSAYVAFEAINAISKYSLDLETLQMEPTRISLPKTLNKATVNKGLEALALGAVGSRLEGRMVALSERGQSRHADSFGWILNITNEEAKTGEFTIKRDNLYDITDAVFLKNGTLLVLERRFTIADGVAMRIRLIKQEEIKPGVVVEGDIIFNAGLSHRIDNMEAVSFFENSAGETVLGFMSDDNYSLLQRTVYFEFVLDKMLLQ